MTIAYLSSIPISDAPEGWMARILRHDVSGHRYAPPTRDRTTAKSVIRTRKPTTRAQPRWTQERIDALPKTSGFLTRIETLTGQRHHGTVFVCRCDGPTIACRKTVTIPGSRWAKDTARPRACKGCGHEARRKAMSVPLNDKGYAIARGFSAKNKAKGK